MAKQSDGAGGRRYHWFMAFEPPLPSTPAFGLSHDLRFPR
jgi:hypothetical protein